MAAGLTNYQISGTERAVGCLTAVRCVAVGSGVRDGRAGGQVVEVVGGKQERVTPARFSQALYAVSCPSRAGCLAMGTRKGSPSQLMVQIGAAGTGDQGDPGEAARRGAAELNLLQQDDLLRGLVRRALQRVLFREVDR